MKKISAWALITAAVMLFPPLTMSETKWIEGFSSGVSGEFPKGWRTRPGQGSAAEQEYKVQDEGGNKYLAADDPSGLSTQIFKMASWNLDNYPLLKWKWRARKLPAGANEGSPSQNDSACGIYVSFGMVRGYALKYVWSSSLPVGTTVKKDDKMYIIVKRSGGGGWANESANIVADATKAWGKVPDRTLSGVGILTDSNATHSAASCDYDNIGYASAE